MIHVNWPSLTDVTTVQYATGNFTYPLTLPLVYFKENTPYFTNLKKGIYCAMHTVQGYGHSSKHKKMKGTKVQTLSVVHAYPCILMNVKIESHGTVTGGRPSSPLDLPH